MSLETLTKKRKQLIFRSWHRGTKEMDLLMGSFADQHVSLFDEAQLAAYEAVLACNDPDLYSWITGKEQPPANEVSDVLTMVLTHKYEPVT